MNIKVFWKRVQRKVRFIVRRPGDYFKAKEILKNTILRKGEDRIVIFLTDLIGDTVYGLAYLKALQDKNPNKRICVVGSRKQKELLESYGEIDELILLEDGSSYDKVGAYMRNNKYSEEGLKNDIFSTVVLYYKNCSCAPNPDGLYQLRTHIFGVGEEAEITYHGFKQLEKISVITDFEMLFHRIVVLNPYSISAFEANIYVYELICRQLNDKGYIVYTNVVGEQEPIRGSKRLCCSIRELYGISCFIPLVVSIRSGILDLLAPSDVNMFVIYENSSKLIKEMYHLSSWKCRGKIKEIYPKDSFREAEDILSELNKFLEVIKYSDRGESKGNFAG